MQTDLQKRDSEIIILNEKLTNVEKKCSENQKNKDAQINGFELRLQELEKEHKTYKKEKEKKIKELENTCKQKARKEKDNDTKVDHFNCTACDFITTSRQGLKTHTTRKHTKLCSEKYPKTCEFCEMELDSEKEMNLHLKTHSYRNEEELKFKCEDCDFWGQNNLTMEVHAGKAHSSNFECGLCDFKAKDLENLETHISTCEIYECSICYFRVTQMCEIKTHMIEKHESDNVLIQHGKQDRRDEEKIDCKEHLRFDLFPKDN